MNLKVKIPYTSVFSDKNSLDCMLAVSDGKFIDIVLDRINTEYYLKVLFNYSNINFNLLDIWNDKVTISYQEKRVFSIISNEIDRSALELKVLSSADSALVDTSKLLNSLNSKLKTSSIDSKYVLLSNIKTSTGMFSFSTYPSSKDKARIQGLFSSYNNFIDYTIQESSGNIPSFSIYPDTFMIVSKNIVISTKSITVIYDNLQDLSKIIRFVESIDIFTSEVYRKKFIKSTLHSLQSNTCNVFNFSIELNQVNYALLKDKYITRINSQHLFILELANTYSLNSNDDMYLIPASESHISTVHYKNYITLDNKYKEFFNSIIRTPKYLPLPKPKILKVPKLDIVEQSIPLIESFIIFSNSSVGYTYANRLLSPIIKTTYFSKLSVDKKQEDILARFEQLYRTNKVALDIQNYISNTKLGTLNGLRCKHISSVPGTIEYSTNNLVAKYPMLENNFDAFDTILDYDYLSSKVLRDTVYPHRNSEVSSFSIIKLIADSIPSSINFLKYFKKETINFSIFANNYLRMLIVLRTLLGHKEFNIAFKQRRRYNRNGQIKGNLHEDIFSTINLEFIVLKKQYDVLKSSISFHNFQEYIIDPITGLNDSGYTKGYCKEHNPNISAKLCKSFSKLAISI